MTWNTSCGMGYNADNARSAFTVFTNSYGFTTAQSAGIVANLIAESGVDPTIAQHGGGPGRGIAQWSVGDRWDELLTWASANHCSPLTLSTQCAFIAHELKTTESQAGLKLTAQTTAAEAAAAFQTWYERPADSDVKLRSNIATLYFQSYAGSIPLYPQRGGIGYQSHTAIMQQGSSGDDVKWLQVRLAIPVQDGEYGPFTGHYVALFQERYGLTADGVAGPQTQGRLSWKSA